MDRKKAERINQELQKNLCQTFQTEAAILLDLACDQDQVLREHFPQVARSHREEILPLDLEEFTSRDIWGKRKTRTTKPRQHGRCQNGKNGSSSDNIVTLDIRRQLSWLVRYGTQEQGGKPHGLFSKELRCPICEARRLPLPHRPGMLPRCLRFNQCSGVDLVDLEVRDGSSAKALNVVCCGTVLQIVQPLRTSYTAKSVMKEFKIARVKHYGWPEIIVHDQGSRIHGK